MSDDDLERFGRLTSDLVDSVRKAVPDLIAEVRRLRQALAAVRAMTEDADIVLLVERFLNGYQP